MCKDYDSESDSMDPEVSDEALQILMAKKEKKKATCNTLLCANKGKDREGNSMDLEEAVKIEDQQKSSKNLEANDESNYWCQFERKESIYKDVISRMNEKIETLNGQIDKYQGLYAYATNQGEKLEAGIISLKTDLEASSKKNEEPLQSFEKEALEAEIISLKEEE